jgi:hypothetical protein
VSGKTTIQLNHQARNKKNGMKINRPFPIARGDATLWHSRPMMEAGFVATQGATSKWSQMNGMSQ